ncbi:MAG: phytanoyl-CoA dioxygenase family protein [Phycisphaeraceae bacterium]
MPGLSENQKAFFHREGYLMVPDVFDDADLQPPIDDINRAIDERVATLMAEGKLSRDYAEEDFERRMARISEETDELALSMWDGRLNGPGFFELITNDKLLDVAESLCGEELIASSVYRLRPKIPSHNKSPVPWHQDSAYFEPYCDKALVLTVWLPLVDATEENGCLWVIPRAHTGQVLPHRWADGKPYLEIDEADLPPGMEKVCCPVPRGGALLLTNRTPHVSFDNRTDRVRWSMDLRYQSAALPTNADITRLAGESEPRGASPEDPDFVPIACFPPEADFLVRSRQRPDEVVDSPAVFAALRERHDKTPLTPRWK